MCHFSFIVLHYWVNDSWFLMTHPVLLLCKSNRMFSRMNMSRPQGRVLLYSSSWLAATMVLRAFCFMSYCTALHCTGNLTISIKKNYICIHHDKYHVLYKETQYDHCVISPNPPISLWDWKKEVNLAYQMPHHHPCQTCSKNTRVSG